MELAAPPLSSHLRFSQKTDPPSVEGNHLRFILASILPDCVSNNNNATLSHIMVKSGEGLYTAQAALIAIVDRSEVVDWN